MTPSSEQLSSATYEDLLVDLAAQREELMVLTAENRAAIRGIPQRLGPRFIDFGICEQTMIGAAAGLALRGRIPVVHALATFLTLRAFEFIRTDVGIAGLPVKLVGAVPGFLSDGNGPTHQALDDVAVLRSIPGMNIFCPADNTELLQGIPHIIECTSPWYIRYYAGHPVAGHATPVELGKAENIGAGTDVAILTYGFLFWEAVQARKILAAGGIDARVLNMRTLAPIDEPAVLGAAEECRLMVTFEDHFVIGGLATIVSEILVRNRITARLLPVGLEQRWFKPALLDDVLEFEGFTGERLAERILNTLH